MDSDSSFDSQDVEEKQIDETLNILYQMRDMCFETKSADSIIGKLAEDVNEMYLEKKRAFTAKCKSDVLVLEMNIGVFSVLKEQRIKLEQDNLLRAVSQTIPFIRECYTGFKLIQIVSMFVKQ